MQYLKFGNTNALECRRNVFEWRTPMQHKATCQQLQLLRVEVTLQLSACRRGFIQRHAYFHSVTSTLSGDGQRTGESAAR